MRYLPLNLRSAFSFLYGAFTPEALAGEVAARAGTGTCLADRSGLYGMVRLARAGRAAGLYTLCGVELLLAGGGSILLYPRHEAGHGQLCRLVTRAHLDNPRGKPLIHPHWLNRLDGLVALLPGRAALAMGSWWVGRIRAELAGPVFLGLCGPEADGSGRGLLRCWARELGIPAVAAPEVVALTPQDLHVHRALVGIARAVRHWDYRPLPEGAGVLPSDRQMRAWFTPGEIKATWQVAELCPFELPLGRRHLPAYDLPPGRSARRELGARCLKALARRGLVDRVHTHRLERELKAIARMGFEEYFLLVHDIVSFARGRGIRCTVRGSAAGSIVTWLLCGGVDPVEHDLLFERFLNDGRHEPPDVDLDFDSLRRDEVLNEVMRRFPGAAAMVATVPTFRARSAVRELALSQGVPREAAGRLTELIPYYTRPHRLAELLAKTPELAGHPLTRRPELVELARGLSRLPRQLSVHLGGVALGPLSDLVPMELSAQGLKVIQLDKDDTEEMGLIKMDLLGLRMHSAIGQSLEALSARGRPVDLENQPLDDPAVYDMLCRTDTVGVFQVESPGQRGMLGRLQPRDFRDLMVDISLFRPGPMKADMVTPYLERRAGREPLAYAHPALEPILAETMGVVVFQEQVLKISHFLAGMSYGQADGLRRAMTHRRSPAEMNRLRDGFLAGCRDQGLDEGLAWLLWEQVSSFASYGFPKSHAAAFAHIAYQSAWLRAHHPLEFFLGLLNAGHVGGYPARVLLNEARRQGIACLGPDINRSGERYLSEEGGGGDAGAIRVPLGVIRGMGPAGVGLVLAARRAMGPFSHRDQLRSRAGLNRGQIKALEAAGALEVLAPPRDLFTGVGPIKRAGA